MGESDIISEPYGVKCPNCETMIKGINKHGSFYFLSALIDILNGCSFQYVASRYLLNTSEGKKLDELYEELRKHNFIGIIDTRKGTFTKFDDAPTNLPLIVTPSEATRARLTNALIEFMEEKADG